MLYSIALHSIQEWFPMHCFRITFALLREKMIDKTLIRTVGLNRLRRICQHAFCCIIFLPSHNAITKCNSCRCTACRDIHYKARNCSLSMSCPICISYASKLLDGVCVRWMRSKSEAKLVISLIPGGCRLCKFKRN